LVRFLLLTGYTRSIHRNNDKSNFYFKRQKISRNDPSMVPK
jgi:hypothetical protein